MFNFEKIVGNLLGEAAPPPTPAPTPTPAPAKSPDWWNRVIKVFNTANSGTGISIPENSLPSGDLATSLNSALGSSSNISPSSYTASYIPIMDLFRSILKANTKIFGGATGNCNVFINKIATLYTTDPGSNIVKTIESWLKRKDLSVQSYGSGGTFLSKDVEAAEIKRKKDVDVAGDVAITTIQGYCILPAVQTIVNRRTTVVARAAALKGLSNPFANVLYNIFNKTYLYVSGQAPISNDWGKVVDGNLYVKTIIMIAIYARLFYESLKCYREDIEQGGEVTEPPQAGPSPKPFSPADPSQTPGKGYIYIIDNGKLPDNWKELVEADAKNNTNTFRKITGTNYYQYTGDEWRRFEMTSKKTGVNASKASLNAAYKDSKLIYVGKYDVTLSKKGAMGTYPGAPVTANESFYQLIDSLLCEVEAANNTSKEEIQNAITKELDTHKYNFIKSLPEDKYFMEFVEKGTIVQFNCDTQDGKPILIKDEEGKIKYYEDPDAPGKPKVFTVGEIDKMSKNGNKEAKDLMNEITGAALYQRENTGVMDRMAAGAKAAAGIAAVGGIKPGLAG